MRWPMVLGTVCGTVSAHASGQAISFVTAATEAHFRLIEKRQTESIEILRGWIEHEEERV